MSRNTNKTSEPVRQGSDHAYSDLSPQLKSAFDAIDAWHASHPDWEQRRRSLPRRADREHPPQEVTELIQFGNDEPNTTRTETPEFAEQKPTPLISPSPSPKSSRHKKRRTNSISPGKLDENTNPKAAKLLKSIDGVEVCISKGIPKISIEISPSQIAQQAADESAGTPEGSHRPCCDTETLQRSILSRLENIERTLVTINEQQASHKRKCSWTDPREDADSAPRDGLNAQRW